MSLSRAEHRDPHPATAHLASIGAASMAADLESGRTTSVSLVNAHLERIGAIDAPGGIGLGAVVALAPDALEVAARLDAERAAGTVRGPLHGVPLLVKDNIEAVGLPGTAGSLALAGRTVVRDAPLVTRLRDAGLVVMGSTNLSEWANLRSAHSASGWSGYGGLTGNPWALDRSAGGSSSGSGAAVAAGLTPLAIGTETDGSITCPASLNGCVGVKPTVGLVPTVGVVPISASQDAAGPMARSVRDAALLLDALAGTDVHAAAIGTVRPDHVRLGVATAWLSGHPGTDAVFLGLTDRLHKAGMTLVSSEVSAGDFLGGDELTVLLCELKDDLDAHLAGRAGDGVRSLEEVVAFNREHADAELAHFGQEFLEQALETQGRASEDYAEARRRCLAWALEECLEAAFAAPEAPEFLVAPSYAPAWKSDLVTGDHFAGGNASPAPSIAGWPVVSLPMGFVGGLPVGVTLIGRPHTEPRLLAVAHAVEDVVGLVAADALRPAWREPVRG